MKMLLTVLMVISLACPVAAQNLTVRLYIVRHGQAYNNVTHPANWSDEQIDRLTPLGQQQVRAAALKLRDKHIDVIYTSLLHRARQTADILGGALRVKVRPALALSSLAGDVEWKTRQANWSQGKDPRPAGGESLHDLWQRLHAFLDSLLPQFAGKSIVLVTHGEVIATLVGEATKVPLLERFAKYDVPNASITVVEIGPSGLTLQQLGK